MRPEKDEIAATISTHEGTHTSFCTAADVGGETTAAAFAIANALRSAQDDLVDPPLIVANTVDRFQDENPRAYNENHPELLKAQNRFYQAARDVIEESDKIA